MIAIIDYGMGNIRSVEQALKYIGAAYIVTSDKEEIFRSDGVILPGRCISKSYGYIGRKRFSSCVTRNWAFKKTTSRHLLRNAAFI